MSEKKTLKDYLDQAKKVEYVEPNNIPIEKWEKQELFFAAISETMTSKYQLKAALLICDMFPPLKIFFKSQLKAYMKKMNERSSETSVSINT